MREINSNNKLTYISLFSGGGIGCYGFKLEKYECIATAELIERRLLIQKHNKVCRYESGYISGDLTTEIIKNRVLDELTKWEKVEKINGLDVLIATPPCQGISVANLKKKNELPRNSLVVESIKITKKIKPKYFIFENVRGFLNATCLDVDGKTKSIKEAIDINLAGEYNILCQVINFKNYGSPSSRTRTLVIGVRKDLLDITPYDIFPAKVDETTVREAIGDLKALNVMGEIDPKDIFHNFRKYPKYMANWIKNLKEGESAFDNKNSNNIPFKIVRGEKVINIRKSGDKYRRWFWDRPAACIHTRNDQLASQDTIHPKDNRVYSIRELMRLMTIPDNFKWTDILPNQLNMLSTDKKKDFLIKNEMNIRQCIGEAVPTVIFKNIARNILKLQESTRIDESKINITIKKEHLTDVKNIRVYIDSNLNNKNYFELSKTVELANAKRHATSAYYTRQDIVFTLIKNLPSPIGLKKIRILEPSVGTGNFLPLLIKKYHDVPEVIIDVVDIDIDTINILKKLLIKINIPNNIRINFICDDFLTHKFENKYDVVIGNPPFKKIKNDNNLLQWYRINKINKKTNNIFSFFLEKSLELSENVALILPKSILSAPEFNATRRLLQDKKLIKIIDYGEKGFKNVKIETIGIVVNNKNYPDKTDVESYTLNTYRIIDQGYITSIHFPYWLIYRNEFFDNISEKLELGIFQVLRDRTLTSKSMSVKGKYRVMKARNITNNGIRLLNNDQFIDNPAISPISKYYFNRKNIIVAPNLSYYPRAILLPLNTVVDGSAAILLPRTERIIKENDLKFFSSIEFFVYYRISRNYSTRSLNIDSNSVYFWGLPINALRYTQLKENNRSGLLFEDSPNSSLFYDNF